MPFELDPEQRDGGAQAEVRPSAVQELSWLLYGIIRGYPPARERSAAAIVEAGPALRAEALSMLQSDAICLPDLSILAERIGVLNADEADTFLAGFERATQLDGVGLQLLSESPTDKQLTLERLDRLRNDAQLARDYAKLLGRIWDLGRDEWDDVGRETVRRTCAAWADELRKGTPFLDLLPRKHILRNPDRPALSALIERRERVVLSPGYFCKPRGGFVIDMATFVHIGGPVEPAQDGADRSGSEMVANRLKVLSDATRVGLLRQLTESPASVTDLARRFRLAQPTVTNHVRMLREAGLLEARKDGARVVYAAPRERLAKLMGDTMHILLEH